MRELRQIKRQGAWVGLLLITIMLGACSSNNNHSRRESEDALASGPEIETLGDGTEPERLQSGSSQFGYAVALSQEYALIGQPDDNTAGVQAGAAYLYERRESGWVELAKLLPTDGAEMAFFGTSVVIEGDTAIIGAPGATDGQGSATVYEQREGEWVRVQTLIASDADVDHGFGTSVALSGQYAIVGSPGDDQAGEGAGAGYVFQRQDGRWLELEAQKLIARDARAYDGFGSSVALAGVNALIGSPHRSDNGELLSDDGAAYVFERHGAEWAEVAMLQASNRMIQDYFGRAVAIGNQIAVVGAPNRDDPGAIYVFSRGDGAWAPTEGAHLVASASTPGDQFGASVALSGRVILVGAYATGYTNEAIGSGLAYVFEPIGAGWVETHQLPTTTEPSLSHFGYAVAVSGVSVLVGAPAILGAGKGQVYVYNDLGFDFVPEPLTEPVDLVEPVDPDKSVDPPEPITPPAPAPVTLPPQIQSIPITQVKLFGILPQITVTDATLASATITLDGQVYPPDTVIIEHGVHDLTVEAADAAGNTSVITIWFSLEPSP